MVNIKPLALGVVVNVATLYKLSHGSPNIFLINWVNRIFLPILRRQYFYCLPVAQCIKLGSNKKHWVILRKLWNTSVLWILLKSKQYSSLLHQRQNFCKESRWLTCGFLVLSVSFNQRWCFDFWVIILFYCIKLN